MMNMMQGNFAMMVPQMVMMGIVNYFFSGFVLGARARSRLRPASPSFARAPLRAGAGKIPFPLTPSFKGMLQRGIQLATLDTAYVTSMSWYFLVMFGMRGLYSIVLGANSETDDTKIMQQQMGMGGAQPGQQPDMGKIFQTEAENLQLVDHNFRLAGAEDRLIKAANASRRPTA